MQYYDNLSDMYKGIVQIVVGLIILFYLMGTLHYIFPLILAFVFIGHGIYQAGWHKKIMAMLPKK